MAVNCTVDELAIVGFVGETVIDCSVTDVTVRVVVPETPIWVAVIVVVPAATAVARPLIEMVAIDVFEDVQPGVVKVCVEPSVELTATVEDELLMALPLVPMHEQCPQPLPMTAGDIGAVEPESKPNPFAKLAALKDGLPPT